MNKREVQIGNVVVGEGHPCFVIAEIGSNHNQDFEMARKLIDAAAEAKVNAVKFQTFRADSHYSRKSPGFTYLKDADTHSLIKSLELNRAWHRPLKEYVESRGLEFLSSPCDPEAIAELQALDMAAYKVASFDLPDTGLIGLMARAGKPIILSTGMADWMDIQRGVDTCRRAGNTQVILLQCTSLYPAPAGLSNLRAMATMRTTFDCLVGYSDHTMGDHVALAAVTLGACVIEKHLTLDRSLPGPDHPFAIEPDELKAMMHRLREVEAALGNGSKNGPRNQEREMYEKGRRSLHARTAIRKGEVITADKLVVKRPGLGIAPFLLDKVIGRTARMDIEADQWITWDMV